MPRFLGSVDRQAITNVLTQLNDVSNKEATLRIKQTKGNVCIRSDSARGKFKGFAIRKGSLVKKTITEQADLVDFINTACKGVGLTAGIKGKKISATQGAEILSKVMEQYQKQDRQSSTMRSVLAMAEKLGKGDVIKQIVDREYDLTFLNKLKENVLCREVYGTQCSDIIAHRIQNLSSKDQKTVQINSASHVGQMTDQQLAVDIFSELKVRTDRMVSGQKMLDMPAEMKKKVRFATDPYVSKIPENTAVKLPAVGGESPKRFHGNYVKLSPNEPFTIATQAPKLQAQGDFWLASFSNDAKVIVDLTQSSELTGKRVDVYYPEKGEALCFASGGMQLTVSCLSEKIHPENSAIKTSTYLVDDGQGDKKEISRIHFTDWIDHNGVDAGVLNQLIDTVDDISGTEGLVMAHCCAGIGRTGTFTLARTAKHRLAGEKLNSFQIKDEILTMGMEGRKQRNQTFIQKAEQMLTLVQFLRSMGTASAPHATRFDDKNVNQAEGVPPIIPPRALTVERFWAHYDDRAASELESKQIWEKTIIDIKKVSSEHHEDILNDFEKLQTGLKQYLLDCLNNNNV